MWKQISNNYAVSIQGEVKNTKTDRILKGDLNSKGYRRVVVDKKKHLVHRLVAITFLGNPNKLSQVNHIDCNKLNNHVNNLEWCNNQYNTEHSYLNGRVSGKVKLSIDSLTHVLACLEDKSVSVRSLAELYNVSTQTIYAVKHGLNIKRLGYL